MFREAVVEGGAQARRRARTEKMYFVEFKAFVARKAELDRTAHVVRQRSGALVERIARTVKSN